MNTKLKLTTLALAMGLATTAQAATITVTANSKTYVDLSTGAITSTPSPYGYDQIMLDKGTFRSLVPTAYTGQQGLNGFANVTSAPAASSYRPLLGDSRRRIPNPRHYFSPRTAPGDTLDTWNRNWWGTTIMPWGVGGGNIRPIGNLFNGGLDSPLGNKLYDQKVLIKNTDKGLIYSRKLPGRGGDVVALDFNQLIIRTSQGNKFIRLRTISYGDPATTTGKTWRNFASNNAYFKYAVAGPDGQFGPEKDMCIGFETDSNNIDVNPNGFAIYNPVEDSIKNGIYKYTNKTFDYNTSGVDKWHKQQFIDFDTIINTDDTPLVNGQKPKTVAPNGKVDITPYAPALNRGYDETCLAAWNNTRPSNYYPSLYQNGFTFIGADTPISSRRSDWMDNDNNPYNNSYRGNDEWDIALSFMGVPQNPWGPMIFQNYRIVTQFRVNTGLIGNNAAGTTRTNPGYAAAVLVSGTPTDVRPDQNIGEAQGTYNLVNDIDTYTMPNGKTVRESLQANGKSVTDLHTTFGTDANGNVVSNQRVFVMYIYDENEDQEVPHKVRVQSYNPQTNEYVIEYEAL